MTASTFVTSAGRTVPAVSTNVMREVDRVAVEAAGLSLSQMMENAGRSLALEALEMLGPSWSTSLVVVLAGTGGNGGGGICAARHLANRGARVSVVLSDPDGLGAVTSAQLAVFRGTPGQVTSMADLGGLRPALVIDALLGYAMAGPPRGPVLEIITWTLGQLTVLSLDVPSGIDATTGDSPGARVMANRTLTLGLPKTGLDCPGVGDLWLADIGIPQSVYRAVGLVVSPAVFDSRFRVSIRPVPPA